MNDKHTPGPWEVVETKWGIGVNAARNPHGDQFDFPIVDDGQVHGDRRGDEATGGTPGANARLIAAAPELLEVLLDAREWHRGDKWRGTAKHAAWQVQMGAIEAAIAKARGEA